MRNFIYTALALAFAVGCAKPKSTFNPYDLPDDDPIIIDIDTAVYHGRGQAPMCWSIYEYAWQKEQDGVGGIDYSKQQWQETIDWVAENLKPYGYDMIITDGFMAMWNDPAVNSDGYMTHYGSVALKDIIAMCEAKGLHLGVYDTPLWKHCADNTMVPGAGVTWGSLTYNESSDSPNVRFPEKTDVFSWVIPSHKGAEECFEGFFKYYASIGVHYVRMDFMCLFEDGTGAGEMPGRGYGRENYRKAFEWIHKYANKYGVFASVVMPHLYNDAEIEAEYGDMIRICADTFTGGWWHVSNWNRGFAGESWPNCANAFDGYVHWNHLCGPDKVILDGDFIRLNVFDNDAERRFEVSLHAIAGGPLNAADQKETIGKSDDGSSNLKFYQNMQINSLVKERFIGHPLGDTANLWDENNQRWWGQCKNGDYVIALFNREDYPVTRSIEFSEFGAEGLWQKTDLWTGVNEGIGSEYSAEIAPHDVKVIRLSRIE